jgi:hypothetical protein
MSIETVVGKIKAKAGNGNGFLIDTVEGWFNASEKVVPYLAKMNKGDEVEVSYFKKGVKKEVTMLKKVGAVVIAPVEQTKPEPKVETTTTATAEKKNYSAYNNPERDAQIRRGNALNAAGAALSGNFAGTDPDTLAEALLIIAQKALDWLEAV